MIIIIFFKLNIRKLYQILQIKPYRNSRVVINLVSLNMIKLEYICMCVDHMAFFPPLHILMHQNIQNSLYLCILSYNNSLRIRHIILRLNAKLNQILLLLISYYIILNFMKCN